MELKKALFQRAFFNSGGYVLLVVLFILLIMIEITYCIIFRIVRFAMKNNYLGIINIKIYTSFAIHMKEKQRKERTRRLIQIGAIFEKYFEIADIDQAEKIAFALKKQVENNKEKILAIDLEKYKEKAKRIEKEG